MLRNLLFLVALCAFFTVVGLGVYTSNKQFNDIVLPDRPVYLFKLFEKDSGVVQIELLGETLAVDIPAVKNRADSYLLVAKQKLQEVKSDSRLIEEVANVKKVMQEPWNAWWESEKVRAVHQWVKERI
ncbi:MAG: hypothetical protein M1609_05865 [Firmicutes bacterium]|nr:hypothetical protein [Bacillota bacterium]MCL5779385.1 hypothetical protein [Bacillota bacterium]